LDGLKDGDALLIARGLKARFFHATLFELTAIILTALYLMLVMGNNFFDMGVLAVAISLIATAWNGVFNFIFDRLQKRLQFSRGAFVRILHSFCFEGGLVILTVPMVAWYLRVSFVTAFLLEAALLLFFLPYSFIFNFIYDKIYIWYSRR